MKEGHFEYGKKYDIIEAANAKDAAYLIVQVCKLTCTNKRSEAIDNTEYIYIITITTKQQRRSNTFDVINV